MTDEAFLYELQFLLTPLREGRRTRCGRRSGGFPYFYSRPCGRGDVDGIKNGFLNMWISTHAPAGGATRHKKP